MIDKEQLLEGMDYNRALALDIETLQELKDYLEGQESFDRGKYTAICNALTELQSKVEKEAEAQERKAVQEEMKETFVLPHDYDKIFGDHRANEEIRRLVNTAIDQTTEYYEAVISSKDEENLAAIRELREKYEEAIASAQRERDEARNAQEQAEAEANDLRNAVRSLNEEKAKLQDELNGIKQQLAQATFEKHDAEKKRDAAVREVESLKAQIVELEQLATASKKTKPEGLKISFTSTITDDKPIMSARELALQRAGLGHLIKPKPVGGMPAGNTFPDAEDRTTDNVAGAEGDSTDQQDQVSREDFRDSDTDLGTGSPMVQDTAACAGSAESDQDVSTATLQKRIEEIEARLSRVEGHLNLRISA